ncbi:hypothetical protein WME75_08100 [Sorangium sp. So ce1014]|uniref:hypothetical protein n=1 Tax=Sorangium sp. So ce1014 TaxID=3133326 RepID=UPI003F619275
MIIKETIQGMLDGLPDPVPNLLTHDQAALVQSCVISLKEVAQQRRWRMVMRLTSANTTLGHKTMLEYLESADDLHCMASAAQDLQLYKDQLMIG